MFELGSESLEPASRVSPAGVCRESVSVASSSLAISCSIRSSRSSRSRSSPQATTSRIACCAESWIRRCWKRRVSSERVAASCATRAHEVRGGSSAYDLKARAWQRTRRRLAAVSKSLIRLLTFGAYGWCEEGQADRGEVLTRRIAPRSGRRARRRTALRHTLRIVRSGTGSVCVESRHERGFGAQTGDAAPVSVRPCVRTARSSDAVCRRRGEGYIMTRLRRAQRPAPSRPVREGFLRRRYPLQYCGGAK